MKRKSIIVTGLLIMLLNVSIAPASSPQRYLTEARALGQFGKNLGDFLNLAETLNRKPSLSASDISSLESKAAGIKGSVTQFRSNLDALIKKHRDAGEWNAQFDSSLESKLAPELKNFARQNGGARRIFESALSQLGGFNSEIDETTGGVRRRFRGSAPAGDAALLNVAYRPAPAFGKLKCALLFVAAAASAVAGFELGEEEATAAFKKNKCGSNAAPTT
ncbi:MAG: hypothetical protein L0229_28790 [Blastocatellia bacterium]|nr:hypothetical protein [Blastocatellia bacterium]